MGGGYCMQTLMHTQEASDAAIIASLRLYAHAPCQCRQVRACAMTTYLASGLPPPGCAPVLTLCEALHGEDVRLC